MQPIPPSGDPADRGHPADVMSALFANLVIQQANMALMFLGKVTHPETGRTLLDLDSAQLVIDQLEMLRVKTKGNLDKQETALLQDSLMNLRLAFVEAAEAPERPATPAQSSPSAPPPTNGPPAPNGPPASSPNSGEEEHRRKFTKKYGES
jgi:hypothetical protein